jgi:hypothetical protein
LSRILGVADPGARSIEQADHCGQHLLARQSLQGQVRLEPLPKSRQRGAERGDPVELVTVARALPLGVIAILFATARVAAGGLHVAARLRADPDLFIGRWDGEARDALQVRRRTQRFSVGRR